MDACGNAHSKCRTISSLRIRTLRIEAVQLQSTPLFCSLTIALHRLMQLLRKLIPAEE